jgi:Ras family protein
MDYWAIGGITKRRLWYGDLGSILGIVKGLDMNGVRGVTWGGHDGRDSRVSRALMNVEHARVHATDHVRVSYGHACLTGREGPGLLVLPVPSDSGINPVLFLPFFLPFPHPPLCPLDMPGDILKKRKIAVLGSRSVGEPAKFIIYDSMLIPLSTTSGKSSLVIQFTENQFIESYYPTIENTFTKSVNYKGVDYDCDIIDTAGQVCTRVLHVALPH